MRNYISALLAFPPVAMVLLFVAMGSHMANAYAAEADQAAKIPCPAQAAKLSVAPDGSMRLNGVAVTPDTYVSVASTIKPASAQTCVYVDSKAQGESIGFVESVVWTHLMAHIPVFNCGDEGFLECVQINNPVPGQ